jgi:hypothetical protein
MGRPEDDHKLWEWEVVATDTRRTRQGPRTQEARVAQRPDGWYILATHLTVPQGPYLTYATAVEAARAAVREGRRRSLE